MKNYIGFVNDHSGSMASIAQAAMRDYNTNIAAVRDAATTEMLDTVVSVVGVGIGGTAHSVTRQVQISNPHVLKPITSWPCPGGTPLYDGIGSMMELLEGLPDAKNPDVSFLVMITTDGEEMHSHKYRTKDIQNAFSRLQATGRWTFVFRVPRGATRQVSMLGVPPGNIQEWETTAAGMAATTQANTQAMTSFFRAKAAGTNSTGAFYADATQVNVAALVDITKKISLYVVPDDQAGIQIRDFILTKRMQYLKGSAFYQLTKTESRVQHTKIILIRDRATGKFFSGNEARDMIGLPRDRNARLHPGDHGKFDIFIQSESINRKLVGGTGVAYWEEIGKPFTQAELDVFSEFNKAKAVAAKPAVVVLPAVTPTNKPTKSPLTPTPRHQYFDTREDARRHCNAIGKPQTMIQNDKAAPKGRRWFV